MINQERELLNDLHLSCRRLEEALPLMAVCELESWKRIYSVVAKETDRIYGRIIDEIEGRGKPQ